MRFLIAFLIPFAIFFALFWNVKKWNVATTWRLVLVSICAVVSVVATALLTFAINNI